MVGTPNALRWIAKPLMPCGLAARGRAAADAPRAPGTTPVTASATAPPAAASRNLVTPCHATNRPTPTRAPAGVSATFQRTEPWERSAARRPVSTAVRGAGAPRPPLVLSPCAGGAARLPLVLSPCAGGAARSPLVLSPCAGGPARSPLVLGRCRTPPWCARPPRVTG